jgi:hypothetical protein
MTEKTAHTIADSYLPLAFAKPENFHILKAARDFLYMLLLNGLTIAAVKKASHSDLDEIMIDDGFTVRLGITKLEVISALKDAVNFKEISEESAIQIAKRHIPEELDNKLGAKHLRNLARYILVQLLLMGFSIADLKVMDLRDIENIDLEWLGQEVVAKSKVMEILNISFLSGPMKPFAKPRF